MRDTYRCKECGFASDTGAGSRPATCPECGGNNLTLTRSRPSPAKPKPTATGPETPKEGP